MQNSIIVTVRFLGDIQKKRRDQICSQKEMLFLSIFNAVGNFFAKDILLSLGVAIAIGMVVAFLVSVAVIKFLLSFIKKNDFQPFGWYRIALGIVVIAFVIAGVVR